MLPQHDEFSLLRRTLSVVAIVAATTLLGFSAFRIAAASELWTWWLVLAAIVGMAAADFLSGIVHWTADTWGNESMPILGRRLLHPFRVHHVNPDDFLRRRFIDTNGDVALLVIPVQVATLQIALDSRWSVTISVLLIAFSSVALLTNQVHQWAHMPNPPAIVALLQSCRLILTHHAHADHHRRPYNANYCIATGWCNKPLTAIHFFRRLERSITWLTGVQPRQDDATFQAESDAGRYAAPQREGTSHAA